MLQNFPIVTGIFTIGEHCNNIYNGEQPAVFSIIPCGTYFFIIKEAYGYFSGRILYH